MSLLDHFSEYFNTIDVYSLTDYTSTFGTTEKKYPNTATTTIEGYIQPSSGNNTFKNQSNDKISTHTLYTYSTVTLNENDRLKFNGNTYQITFYQKSGIAGIADHKEIGLEIL